MLSLRRLRLHHLRALVFVQASSYARQSPIWIKRWTVPRKEALALPWPFRAPENLRYPTGSTSFGRPFETVAVMTDLGFTGVAACAQSLAGSRPRRIHANRIPSPGYPADEAAANQTIGLFRPVPERARRPIQTQLLLMRRPAPRRSAFGCEACGNRPVLICGLPLCAPPSRVCSWRVCAGSSD